jgi:hypothetical protein
VRDEVVGTAVIGGDEEGRPRATRRKLVEAASDLTDHRVRGAERAQIARVIVGVGIFVRLAQADEQEPRCVSLQVADREAPGVAVRTEVAVAGVAACACPLLQQAAKRRVPRE